MTMNIYQSLNKMINTIEEQLEEEIDYQELAKIMGTTKPMLERLFSLLCGLTLTEYIRKRRLSCAGVDLATTNLRVIDIAVKYQYDNPTSFSRAFTKFHGMKPSEVKKQKIDLKNFPKLYFEEMIRKHENISYDIVRKKKFTLYGVGIKTDDHNISKDAPIFFGKMKNKYEKKHGRIPYGMVSYEDRFKSDLYEYWILYDKKIEGFEKVEFPESKWLVFHIPSQEAEDIQKVSNKFYYEFLPSAKYHLRRLPELEYYYEDKTDFLIPID